MLERYGHVRDAEAQRAITATHAAVEQALQAQPETATSAESQAG